ncbi:hypothetical protein ABZZ20_32435 [Streptomyces sp. NPDC006430]
MDEGVVALRLASDVLLVDWGGAEVPVPGERIRFAVRLAELYPYAL